jgi:uncharacterized DUF497 family protein
LAVEVTYDPQKRAWTLVERGLDFDEARIVFNGRIFEFEDDRRDYGEIRYLTFGKLRDRLVAVVWTPRGGARHIISMRKCNDREECKFLDRLG